MERDIGENFFHSSQGAYEGENQYGPNVSQFEGLYQNVKMRFNK